jgi:tetratricopeptide (TPR) repeat protein
LFPQEGKEEIMTAPLTEEVKPTRRNEEELLVRNHKVFERVKKQIATIAQAVSQGHNTKAEKFLRELVQQQTSLSGGESYAVKSLCNIAQQCADMFRMDFEVVCIEEARRMDPSDIWTLIQHGDHLKRVGNYDEALKVFAQAEQFGESEVAKSCEADVYSQQSDYVKAINTYETIPNWKDNPRVLTAIADNLRRMGRMEDAQDAYDRLINSARQGLLEYVNIEVRAQAGIAEIEKRQGKFEDALQTYYRIIAREDVDDRDRLFYKLGLCNVLKLMGKFNDAYAVVDEVIQQYPFAMEARFIRGSILGLIGRELEGLKDLPESSGSRSFREWLRRYYRGLLLLKLERYEGAKKNLVDELPRALASGEEKAILRMAAALYFLRHGETSEADDILSEIPDLYDCHTKYLFLVLKLHSATQKEDRATIISLNKCIAGLKVVDARLEKAVVALEERDFSLALTCETDSLLKLAA